MAKYPWTEAQRNQIRNNYLKYPISKMSKMFSIEKGVISRFMKSEGLYVTKEQIEKWRVQNLSGRTSSTPEIDDYLKANYLIVNVNQISIALNRSETFVKGRLRQLELIIPQELRDQRKKIGQRQKGDIPFNKGLKQKDYMTSEAINRTKATRFQKGQQPHNTYDKDGVITIRKDSNGKGYKYIRVRAGKWKLLHQYVWEKEYGPVPKGHCLWFKDGNPLNCTLDNLECITRNENVRRNQAQHNNYPEPLKRLIQLNNKLKKQIHDTHRKENTADAQ